MTCEDFSNLNKTKMILTKLLNGKMFNSLLFNVCCTILLSKTYSCARLYEERVSLFYLLCFIKLIKTCVDRPYKTLLRTILLFVNLIKILYRINFLEHTTPSRRHKNLKILKHKFFFYNIYIIYLYSISILMFSLRFFFFFSILQLIYDLMSKRLK